MKTMAKRVCIIGAGLSGLTTIKCCLNEGLEPTCFEMGDDIGGLWKYQENVEEGRGNVFYSLITNSSKEFMAYSDFPTPENFPNFLAHTHMFQYLQAYAKEFKLNERIHLKTKVEAVTKTEDFQSSGQWNVTTVDENGIKNDMVFDAVMVCSGHNYNPNMPMDSFPGIENFKGKIIHSKDYKKPSAYAGKNVLVIGFGNSGGDIATEVSEHASQVFLSTRRGAWVLGRISDRGYPYDLLLLTRWKNLLRHYIPWDMFLKFEERNANFRFDHKIFGANPTFRIFSQQMVVNDNLPLCIMKGKLSMKPNVASFTDTAAVFVDGSQAESLDVVVFATGFCFQFPFLEVDDTFTVHDNCNCLYKNVFLPKIQPPTLAFINLVEANVSATSVCEMQSRWVTRIFKGLISLPDEAEMLKEISQEQEIYSHKFPNLKRHTIEIEDCPAYTDDLASQIGVRPRLLPLFLKDPGLALKIFFGPLTNYQFRLQGPGRWEGAAQAIRTQDHRVMVPFPGGSVTCSNTQGFGLVNLIVSLVLLAGCCLVVWFQTS
uniref:flavin-containing monooxygenase 5-like isoform X1 n=2 Tax=Myxine glutinosa TaxID=7769 RepID=UPI00358F008B